MKHRNLKIGGFTLVEIIVSLAILGIIVATFLALFGSNYATIYTMGRKTQAMNNEAQTYMDQIYSGEESVADIDSLDNVTATSTSYTGMSTLKQITITVNYSTNRSVTLTSLVP